MNKSIENQVNRLSSLEEQFAKASDSSGVVWIGGDWNLDASRFDEKDWRLKSVAEKFVDVYERAGLHQKRVGPTFTYTVNDEVFTSELDYFLTNNFPVFSSRTGYFHLTNSF